MPLWRNFDVSEMSCVAGSDNATEAVCVQFVLELPKRVPLEVLTCSGSEKGSKVEELLHVSFWDLTDEKGFAPRQLEHLPFQP
jgi:hypothetical protein